MKKTLAIVVIVSVFGATTFAIAAASQFGKSKRKKAVGIGSEPPPAEAAGESFPQANLTPPSAPPSLSPNRQPPVPQARRHQDMVLPPPKVRRVRDTTLLYDETTKKHRKTANALPQIEPEIQVLRKEYLHIARERAELMDVESLRTEIAAFRGNVLQLKAKKRLSAAQNLLRQLVKEFPQSDAAAQAKQMLEVKHRSVENRDSPLEPAQFFDEPAPIEAGTPPVEAEAPPAVESTSGKSS